ncbi:DUF1343 domain-containing protein [Actinokineospora auranticolor]|uniref:Uncharacterized protein YbbC (DUF1343 family) n=1 Tax=Actinokineospora auranticolor TaxID=155976 RepID=A0A2S6GKM3_9PSEU|nr:DUF1343 domain-containing protein [Actinokineospora auranticolor]PPK65794.1 uncharacterized protein YbbC (DUF1343 family) [Actinokineospora auranticolor]
MDRRRFLTASVGVAATGSTLVAATPAQPTALAETLGQPRPSRVTPGADVLAEQHWRRLAGHRVGVVSNPTGITRDGTHVVDSMVAAGVRPVAVFGPEHGFRGTAQAGGSEGDYRDPRTDLPVYDTYGKTAAQVAAQFAKAGVDLVVFDIADVGARFYTYIWTMYTAMHAAVLAGAAFLVLDRPNPVGGRAYGPVLNLAYASAIGLKPIVQQHGMTVGELAALFDAEFLPQDAGKRLRELQVVEVRDWRRDRLFAQTGLTWVMPSPNMPTPQTALVYPGTGLFEGTTLSEGRGTTRPFEIIGAPGMDWRWADALNGHGLAGVGFREHYFQPTFGKFTGVACGGVQVHLTGAADYDAITTAVTMLVSARLLYPEVFAWRPDNYVDKLSGSDRLRHMVDAGAGILEVVGAWQAELAAFHERRAPYLRYR